MQTGQSSQASSKSRQSKAKNPIPNGELAQFIGFEVEREMLVLLAHNEDLVQAPELGPHLFGDATNGLIYQTLVDYVEHEPDAYTEGYLIAYVRRVPERWDNIDGDNRFVSLFGNIHPREDFDFLLSRLRYHLARRLAYLEHRAGIQALLEDKNLELNPAAAFRKSADKIESLAPYNPPVSTLEGSDPITYSEMDLDMSLVLAGDRWLSRKTAAMLVAPSGHGKSIFATQLAIGWSCGRTTFGIKPSGPLRIFCVQAEDDKNDVIEFCRMIRRMQLLEEEKEQVRKNAHFEHVDDCIGGGFFSRLRSMLRARKQTDLLVINPLTAYLGKDPRDASSNIEFFRVKLAGILAEFECGCLIVHHTPKTNFIKTEDFNWWDWMYVASGDAGIVNWIRSCLVIWPTVLEGTYRFIAAKRRKRIGWTESEYYFNWSEVDGVCLWMPSNNDQIKEAQESKKDRSTSQAKDKHKRDILALIPKIDPISQERLFHLAPCGERRVRNIVNVLIEDSKVFEHKLPRFKDGKKIKSGVGYSQTKPVTEESC